MNIELNLGFVADTVGYVTGGDHFASQFAMTRLIIEEHIGGEGFEKGGLLQTAQEQRFVQADIPFAQGADHSLMGRCRTRRHQGGADRTTIVGEFALQQIERGEEAFERPPRNGSRADSRSLA